MVKRSRLKRNVGRKKVTRLPRTKVNIIVAWNEADEVLQDLALSDEEIMTIIPDIRKRVRTIEKHLRDEFTVNEYNKVFRDPRLE